MGSASLPPHPLLLRRAPPVRRHPRVVSLHPSFPSLFFQFPSPPRLLALRAVAGAQGGGGEGTGSQDPAPLRRPVASSVVDVYDEEEDTGGGGESDESEEEKYTRGRREGRRKKRDAEWVDWEDQILEDTVPLVGFVRMILHSGKYESGDRLGPEHEKTIVERLLMHHPQYEKKIGCGIDYITIGYHPDYESSRCLFIARKDGELVDFSYWKCIKSLIRKKYPLYADSFILRHFRRRRNSD